MLALIAAIVVGIVFGLFATSNTSLVSLQAGQYLIPEIPLYLVIFGSFLIGLLIAWILSGIGSISSWFTIHQKDSELKQLQLTTSHLREKIRALEIENQRLHNNHTTTESYSEVEHIPQSDKQAYQPSIFDKLRHTLSPQKRYS
jgi:uncharacterized integral membrane protein